MGCESALDTHYARHAIAEDLDARVSEESLCGIPWSSYIAHAGLPP